MRAKKLVSFLLAASLCAGLSACAPTTGGGGSQSAAPQPSAGEPYLHE